METGAEGEARALEAAAELDAALEAREMPSALG